MSLLARGNTRPPPHVPATRSRVGLVALLACALALPSPAANMDPHMIQTFGPFTDEFHETGGQVADWVARRAREHFRRAQAERAAISTSDELAAYQRGVRDRFLASIGGLPEPAPELGLVETGRVERDGYHIRKIVYTSLPGVHVSALLYVPARLEGRAPAVLVACGHSRDGKTAPAYQRVCINLVREGFVVLIADAPGHAEMVQCLASDGSPAVGLNTREHSRLQLAASIVGRNIARYFIANARRGIDLLQSLPEVDPGRIGFTGNSGGGTLTQYMLAVEPRVKAAMPACSFATRESYLATGVRSYDGEQNLFGAISGSLDCTELIAAAAPRPVRIGAAEHDYFSLDGAILAYERAKELYRVAGAPDAVDLVVAKDESHGFSAPLRRACVEWFVRHLQGREVGEVEVEPAVERAETLQVTRTGQVLREFPGSRPLIELDRDHWTALRASSAPALSREELVATLAPDTPPSPLRPRRTARSVSDDVVAERVFFFSEPEIVVTAAVYRPARGKIRRAVLLLVPDGTEGQQPFAEEIRDRVGSGELVMVFDVRGTGAVRMHRRNPGSGLAPRGTEFRVANDHFMLGTSLAARRAFDVTRALEYLRLHALADAADTPVTIVGRGWPAIYGLLAAAMDGNVANPVFSGLPASWGEAFAAAPENPEQIAPSLIVPELRGRADIADLLRLAGGTRE